jgi:exonuclease VII large subunit
LNVLRRGYTLTKNERDQSLVRHVSQVQPGDVVRTMMPGGWALSRVEAVQEAGPTHAFSQGRPPAARMP